MIFGEKKYDKRNNEKNMKKLSKIWQEQGIRQEKTATEAKAQARADYINEYNKLTNEQKAVLKILNDRIDTHNSTTNHSGTDTKTYYTIEQFLNLGISTEAQLNNFDKQEKKANEQHRINNQIIYDIQGTELDEKRKKEQREKEQRDQERSRDPNYLAEIERSMEIRNHMLRKNK
jgi:hypothetical protein